MPTFIEEIAMPEQSATMLDRLKYLRTISRKTQAQFAKLLNIDPSSMSKILTDKTAITDQFINRVVVNLGVSKQWFTTGEGVPFPKAEGMSSVDGDGVVISSCPKGSPVYDIDVTAGCTPLSNMFTRDNIMGYIDLPNLSRQSPVVKVSGDSMQPRIPDGALIAIRPINDPSVLLWGSVYVVELEDYRLVKVVRKCKDDPSKIILHSENPEYDDIEVKRSSVLKFFIVESVLNYKALA